LERPRAIGALPGLDHHSYDFIALAEVLEHLVVNPVELLEQLLNLLKPTGALYLTTPNIFRAELRKKWTALENPNAIYPKSGENWDKHHHHREFGAVELLRLIQQAGGEIRAFYYSSCWDRGDVFPPDQRANLVYLVQPATSAPDRK
jgi:2-polyprenyl-3-methyl-5-hydroxy-6-metoxy-1,4-benzoquinol methylase